MNMTNPLVEIIDLIRAAGPELWFEARAACEKGPRWAVFLTCRESILLDEAPPEILARLGQLRPGQALSAALPHEEILRGLPFKEGSDAYEVIVEELNEGPSLDECQLVIVMRSTVITFSCPMLAPVSVGHA